MNRTVFAGVLCSVVALAGCGPSEAEFMGAPVCPNTTQFIATGAVGGTPLEGSTVTGTSSTTVPSQTDSKFILLDANGNPLLQLNWAGSFTDGQIFQLKNANALIPDGVYANMHLCATSGLVRLGVVNGSGQFVLRGLYLSPGSCEGNRTILTGEVKGCFR